VKASIKKQQPSDKPGWRQFELEISFE
jgi:hypothetical protein